MDKEISEKVINKCLETSRTILSDIKETNQILNKQQNETENLKTGINLASQSPVNIDDSEPFEKYDLLKALSKEDLYDLLKINHYIDSIKEPELLFEKVMTFILEKIDVDRAALFSFDKNLLEFKLKFASNIDREAENNARLFSQSILTEAERAKESILFSDVAGEYKFISSESIRLQKIRSVLCVPIAEEKEILGTIYLDTVERTSALGQREKMLVEEIARKIAKSLKKIHELMTLEKENLSLRLSTSEHGFHGIIGQSTKIREIFKTIKTFAQNDENILIEGETGTGKELIVNAIHKLSSRKDKKLVKCVISSLPDTLVASELYGHTKGSFTDAKYDKAGIFQIADGGIVFLDEIDSLRPEIQVQVLRTVEYKYIKKIGEEIEKEIDFRLIAACSQNIQSLVEKGNFRMDLYQRLNRLRIQVPPLRERKEDIPLLLRHFLDKYRKTIPHKISEISKSALKWMQDYDWPGNIRELENLVARIVHLFPEKYLLDEELLNLPMIGFQEVRDISEEKRTLHNALRLFFLANKSYRSMQIEDIDDGALEVLIENKISIKNPGKLNETLNELLPFIPEKSKILGASPVADYFALLTHHNKELHEKYDQLIKLRPLHKVQAFIEKEILLVSLKMHNGNITAVAKDLEISRQSIYQKIKEHGIDTEKL